MKKIKAIKYNERICFKCLKESDNIHKYSIKMYQWTCECCGEIIYTHTYSDVFSCPKCHQYYECYDE